MAAVKSVAKLTHATKGRPARAATGSARVASLENSMPVAIIVAAAAVLSARLRRLKNKRLQAPIMKTFQDSHPRALRRAAESGDRSSR